MSNKPAVKAAVPKIQDLQENPVQAFKNDQLKSILYQPTPAQWVKKHPFAKDVNYLPIGKVEFMLDRIFQEWKVEIINYQQMFNAVTVHIRLHYIDPTQGVWKFHDGVGAVGIQTDKGAQASDMMSIKQDAVMKALPAAKSYAIKDAAEHLGPVFGRDLNRKDSMAWQQMYEGNPAFVVDPFSSKADIIVELAHRVHGGNHHYESIKNKVSSGLMTHEEANKVIQDLKDSLPDPIESGANYTATDIKKKVESIVNEK